MSAYALVSPLCAPGPVPGFIALGTRSRPVRSRWGQRMTPAIRAVLPQRPGVAPSSATGWDPWRAGSAGAASGRRPNAPVGNGGGCGEEDAGPQHRELGGGNPRALGAAPAALLPPAAAARFDFVSRKDRAEAAAAAGTEPDRVGHRGVPRWAPAARRHWGCR